jgi:hypothetical protein
MFRAGRTRRRVISLAKLQPNSAGKRYRLRNAPATRRLHAVRGF